MSAEGITRRELLRRGGFAGSLLAVPAAWREAAVAEAAPSLPAPAAAGLRVGPEIYQSIGVRPFVNARGTYTILSGSTMLPEVRAAMEAAAQHYVHLDELAEAVGARLAALTGAEWGLVTVGCAAALTHATAACVAGGNPDLHVRIPNLSGFAKDEAIIPKHSRNVYDAALRAVGVRVIEVTTPAELEAALGPRTAVVYILAGPEADESALPTKVIASIAQPRGVPVLVDAAAEILTVPNVHLKDGATLVAYSGGKCLRGPQAAGLLLGRKDLVRAAWVHSAPHHGYSRSMKVGKEEAIGMLMAVEMWMKRDHDAEWKQWTSWLEQIGRRVSTIDGVTTSIVQPRGLSNRMPSLRVFWDRKRLGLSGDAVIKTLFDSEPRISMFAARHETDPSLTGVQVNPYMMAPGDEKVVADRLYALLTSPSRKDDTDGSASPAADLSGQWEVRIDYTAGASNHTLNLRQRGNEIDGAHRGDYVSRDLTGTIDGDRVRLRSAYSEQNGDALNYTFTGKVTGDEMAGTLDMGEYLTGRWTAKRRAARKA
ncbi:MAG TPA: aminotransferase class V-fold PLP-dependent enzyme [Vicinamibacteria bacterium]